MKNVFYFIFLLSLTYLVNCDRDKPFASFAKFEPGNYEGFSAFTYYFGTDSALTSKVEVNMSFTENRFTYIPKPFGFAPPTDGDYLIKGNKMDMTVDLVPVLAIFAPPSILYGGEFTYHVTGTTVTLTQFNRDMKTYWKIILENFDN